MSNGLVQGHQDVLASVSTIRYPWFTSGGITHLRGKSKSHAAPYQSTNVNITQPHDGCQMSALFTFL